MSPKGKQYVAGLLFGDIRARVMLIRKSHPEWMKGNLNGIGGHIEPDELPEYAMYREFAEETGINIANWHWKHFATITGSEVGEEPWIVYWYTAAINQSKNYPPFQEGGSIPNISEPVAWFDVDLVTRGMHGCMMPNLCWLIYMAKARIEGIDRATSFTIHESYT